MVSESSLQELGLWLRPFLSSATRMLRGCFSKKPCVAIFLGPYDALTGSCAAGLAIESLERWPSNGWVLKFRSRNRA